MRMSFFPFLAENIGFVVVSLFSYNFSFSFKRTCVYEKVNCKKPKLKNIKGSETIFPCTALFC